MLNPMIILAMALCGLPISSLAATTMKTETTITETGVSNLASLPDVDKLLARLVDKAIIPLYEELAATTDAFIAQGKTFCAAPNTTHFTALRAAWGETMLAWQRTDPLLFGPAIAEQRDYHINFSPPKKGIIKRLLASDTPITPERIEEAGVGGKGLSTLEFLLFDREKTDDEILSEFQGETGKSHCDYLLAASALLQRDIQAITHPWIDKDNTYAREFRQAGQGSQIFSVARQPIDLVVSKLYQTAEKVALQKIAKPLGKDNEGNAPSSQAANYTRAHQLEAWRSGYSIAITRANIEGIQRIMRDGGLIDWLSAQENIPSAAFIAKQMALRLDNYLRLPIPTESAFDLIQQDKGKLLDNYYYMADDLQMGLATQFAKAMGTPFGFNENDGD